MEGLELMFQALPAMGLFDDGLDLRMIVGLNLHRRSPQRSELLLSSCSSIVERSSR